MAGGEYYGSAEFCLPCLAVGRCLFSPYAYNLVCAVSFLLRYELSHACAEMHLSAAGDNSLAHVLNDSWQLVGAYVGVRVGENGCGGAVLAEHVQYLVHAASLL